MFFKVHGSKEMGCCVYIQCSENDGNPWLLCSFGKEIHYWWLQCTYIAMSDEEVRENVKDNDGGNVLFMRRKKWQMNGSVFLLVVFTFCFKQFCILSNVWVLGLLEWLKGKIINVNHWQLKLMSCPKEHRTSVKKFTTVIMFVWRKALWMWLL